MSEFIPTSLIDLAVYCQDRSDDRKLPVKLELADRWASTALRFHRQYNEALQPSILPALQIANNADSSEGMYWKEGHPLIIEDFEIVMGAAEVLSKLWKEKKEFIAWTKDAPYLNNYGNWIDPLNKTSIEDKEYAEKLRQTRLAA
jgi:hypothetical protein